MMALAFADSEKNIYLRVNKFVLKLVSELASLGDPSYSLPSTYMHKHHRHMTLSPTVEWSIERSHSTRIQTLHMTLVCRASRQAKHVKSSHFPTEYEQEVKAKIK